MAGTNVSMLNLPEEAPVEDDCSSLATNEARFLSLRTCTLPPGGHFKLSLPMHITVLEIEGRFLYVQQLETAYLPPYYGRFEWRRAERADRFKCLPDTKDDVLYLLPGSMRNVDCRTT